MTADEQRERQAVEQLKRERAKNPHRVWVGPLVGVSVDGQRTPTVPESREVIREELRQKVAAARRRFKRIGT